MPIEIRPLFRADVVRAQMQASAPIEIDEAQVEQLRAWARLLAPPGGDALRESEHLPRFVHEIFVELLGYRGQLDAPDNYSFARERHNQVDGKFADALLGRFGESSHQISIVIEGKGPRDPLDRPFGGRRRSAVEQAYSYAINLRCDWIIVTSMRELRLYAKHADQRSFERFTISELANDVNALRRFIYLLGAQRVLLADGNCHLDELFEASQQQGRRVTNEFYADYRRVRREMLDGVLQHNPALQPARLLSHVQKLIDRALFVAFCEDRALLPEHSLAKALDFTNPYNPQPKWENLKGLFQAVDEGSDPLNIPLFNGGLFASDSELDQLSIPDPVAEHLRIFGSYDFRQASEAWTSNDGDVAEEAPAIDVEILGHIFEQSIEDLERLRVELESGSYSPAASGRVRQGRGVSRRNREGAFYTPAFATRYMVRAALDPVLAARFEIVRRRVLEIARVNAEAQTAKGRRRRVDRAYEVLGDPNVFDVASLTTAQSAVLTNFWEAWLLDLKSVRILDIACGSGAFLIEAFDQMMAVYEAANGRLSELTGQRTLFEADTTVLRNNLFGIDLNHEAIEIARLSIWIKTARRGRPLTDLDDRIIQGNSVIELLALDPHAIDPRAEFPTVFDTPSSQSGFDVIVGNPPYVRDELLGPYKRYFENQFATYHGGADLYVYFIERALKLLRPGGQLAFVTPNKWLRATYAEPLRRYLTEQAWPTQIVDFGHARKFFPDADVSPCILVAQRPNETAQEPPVVIGCAVPRDQLQIDDLSNQLEAEGFELPRAELLPTIWRVEHPRTMMLLRKIEASGQRLQDYVGTKPAYGIKTGFNEAFFISDEVRAELIRQDPNSNDIIKPYLRGMDVERWASVERTGWMIFARRGIDIGRYPAVERHFNRFRERLEPKPRDHRGEWGGRKAGSYAWYELQDSVDYWEQLEAPKIIFQDIAWSPRFCLDGNGRYLNNTAYFVQSGDAYLLGILNSPVFWWYAWRTAQHGKDEALRLFGEFMAEVPIPDVSNDVRARIGAVATELTALGSEALERRSAIARWLRLQHEIDTPKKMLSQEALADEGAFVRAITAARGRQRPLTAAGVTNVIDEYRSFTPRLAQIVSASVGLERQLALEVIAAYGLNVEETREFWRTAPPRTPLIDESGPSPEQIETEASQAPL